MVIGKPVAECGNVGCNVGCAGFSVDMLIRV